MKFDHLYKRQINSKLCYNEEVLRHVSSLRAQFLDKLFKFNGMHLGNQGLGYACPCSQQLNIETLWI